MTRPRYVVPGYVEVCSRTLERRLALLPRTQVKQLMRYVFAYAAQKYGISIHALCVMGNHYHMLLYDGRGLLPRFMSLANGLIARALNSRYERDDKFWSADSYGALRPVDREDLLRRYTYILTNPSAANLVRYNHSYPGIWSGPNTIGRASIVERPDYFFKEDGAMPQCVTLEYEVPELFSNMGRDWLCSEVTRRIALAEKAHAADRRRAGTTVIGARRLKQARWDERPTSKEQWFTVDPGIASHDVAARVAAIRELQRFRDAYREAWIAWRDGDTDVEFPRGSYWMPTYAHARCRAPS